MKTEQEQMEGPAWTLSNGTLTINSTEAMKDYNDTSDIPWYGYRESIKAVNIQDGVTRIGNKAFSNCIGLTSVTIPDSVETIGCHAFDGCRILEPITIPNFVKTIGDNAFAYCSSLTSITIPKLVTSIGSYAFNGCGLLKCVMVLRTTPPSITYFPSGYGTFYGIPLNHATLYVPKGCKKKYEEEEGWKDLKFKEIKDTLTPAEE
jgi:hypothetical protein